MKIDTRFSCNTIIFVSSPRENEEGTPRRIAEDLSDGLGLDGKYAFRQFDIPTRADFFKLMREIETQVRRGVRPIIHLDMHGDKDAGLEVGRSGEKIAWNELVDALRPINIEAKNNLLLVITACHGLHLIRSITIEAPTPLFALIAPSMEITFGDVDDTVIPFYRELFTSESLDRAYQLLQYKFNYFHSEKMLVIAMARYIKTRCRGRGGAERREALLTEVMKGPMENTRWNRRSVRQDIKNRIKPGQDLLNRYKLQFLHGRTSAVTMAEILAELEKYKD